MSDDCGHDRPDSMVQKEFARLRRERDEARAEVERLRAFDGRFIAALEPVWPDYSKDKVGNMVKQWCKTADELDAERARADALLDLVWRGTREVTDRERWLADARDALAKHGSKR